MATADDFRKLNESYRLLELKGRVEELRSERSILLESQLSGNQKTNEFVSYFQQELEKKEKIIDRLNETVVKLEVERDLRILSVEKFCQSQLDGVVSETSREKQELLNRLQSLQSELDGILEFRRNKESIESEIDSNHARLQELRQQNEAAMKSIDRRRVDDLTQLQRETEKRIAQMMYAVRREAQRGVDADTRKIVADNRRMGEELKFLMFQTGDLGKLCLSMEQTSRQLRNEVEDYQQKEELYAREGVRKTQLNREVRERKAKLEKDRDEFEQKCQRQMDAYRLQHKKDAIKLKEKIEQLHSLLKLKNREIQMIQNYGQVVLDQRTEMEQLFLDALDHIKKEIQIRKRVEYQEQVIQYTNQLKDEAEPALLYPTIHTRGSESSLTRLTPPSVPGEVSLEHFSWEDSVQVLRIFFARINSSQRSLDVPQHSEQKKLNFSGVFPSEFASDGTALEEGDDYGTQPELL